MELLNQRMASLEALDVQPNRPDDFDAFWDQALLAVHSRPLNVQGRTVEHPIAMMEVRDLSFEGLDGTPIRTWLLLPAQRSGLVPAVVSYHGASGSRGLPSSHLQWVAMGCAVVTHDYRLQGGLTGSNSGFANGAGNPQLTTLGVLDPKSWYFYHAYTDALRALRLAREAPEIDSARVCVQGGSQGGGMALAAAALVPEVALCMADVASACWLEKRLFDRAGGYGQIAELLRRHPDQLPAVLRTLRMYDNLNLADRIRCRVLVSVGLKDPVVPPETTYAAFNRITAPKEIVAYPFGEHDGGGAVHNERKLAFLRQHLLS